MILTQDTPFVAATKRNYPLARERIKAAYPDAPAHLMSDLVRNAAALLASDEVSGRVKGRGVVSGAHTPGPWELRVNGVFLRVVHGEHKTTVADGVVGEANARLLAAAPDLLEALELLLNDYVRLAEESGCDLIGSSWDPEVARARAALAKARGQ